MQAEILIAARQRQNGQRRVLGTGRPFVRPGGDGGQRGLRVGTAPRKNEKKGAKRRGTGQGADQAEYFPA